jgi:NADH:ubiquinone oxidoreductase subunit E
MTDGNGAVDLSLLDEVFEQYQRQKGALIPILQKSQDKYGYLPPEVLQLIARKLGISVSKVFGVATFYAQFYLEKRGRHILRLCDGTACHVRGTPMLATAIEEHYGIDPGETTDDGELTVEIVYCIGSCALAPVAIMDDDVMGRMKQDKLLRTIKKTIKAA